MKIVGKLHWFGVVLEDIQDRMKKVICTGRSLEVQISKRALSIGWDGYNWIKM